MYACPQLCASIHYFAAIVCIFVCRESAVQQVESSVDERHAACWVRAAGLCVSRSEAIQAVAVNQ